MGFSFLGASVNGDVVHVDGHIPPVDEVSEDGVHHSLEGGWRVGEPEEHHCRFEEPFICYERCLPPVLWFDKDLIISPFDIEPSEQGGSP